MSTAAATYSNQGSPIMSNPSDNKITETARKIKALRSLTQSTGFITSRSIGALLSCLTPEELVQVSDLIELSPRELPHR